MIVATTFVAGAQEASKKVSGFVETETTVTRDGKPTHQVNLFVAKPLTKTFGLYAWGQTSRGYSQVYAGPTANLNGNVQVGVALGVEQASRKFRKAVFVYASSGRWSNSTIVEQGGSGTWAQNVTSFKANDDYALKLRAQRFLGIGGEVQRRITGRVSAKAGVYRDPESHRTRATVGLKIGF